MKKLLLTILTLITMVAMVTAQTVSPSIKLNSHKPFGQLTLRPYGWHDSRQVSAQSLDVTSTSGGASLLWLNDGLNNNFTAFSYPVYQVGGLGNRVNVVALGAYQMGSVKTNIYTGAGLSLNLLNSGGWNLDLYGGLKGLNVTQNFTFAQGRDAFVFGLGLTVPLNK